MKFVENRAGYLILLGMLMSVLFINAQEIYKQETDVDLKVSCLTSSGGACDGVNCTLSILYSNDTYLIDNQTMTQNGLFFNLTLNQTQTSTIDDYKGFGACFNGTGYATKDFLFSITPNGQRITLEGALIQLGLLALLLIFLVGSMVGHFKASHAATRTGLLLASYGLVTLIFGMAWLMSASYLSIDIFTTILHNLFLIFLYGMFPFVIFIVAMFFLHVIQEMKLAKQVKRGLGPRSGKR